MLYADEVRPLADVDTGGPQKLRDGEVALARKLVEQLSADAFHPERYKDEYRERVQEVVQKKVEGQEVTAAEPTPARAQVIDLMDALKASLARKGPRPPAAAEREPVGKRRPAAAARRGEMQGSRRRAHSKK
jgi:DNA end-binding protein Ku